MQDMLKPQTGSDYTGLCKACGAPANYTCNLCGYLFCPEHRDHQTHMHL